MNAIRPLPSPPLDVAQWRVARRAAMLPQRMKIPAEDARRADERIGQLLGAGFPMLRELDLGFYWPIRGEVDPRVAVHSFRSLGARTALPVVIARDTPLEFREWRPDSPTRSGVFGLPIPIDTDILVPRAVLVPPIGIDAHGYRLGYGGGYFDRTLAALSPRPLAIALARESSRIDTIHPQPHDIPMDFVITEKGIHHVAAEGLRLVPEPEEVAQIAAKILEARRAMSIDEVGQLLNTLLEAERAGARVLAAFLGEMELSPGARGALTRVQRDEAANCAVLIELLHHIGVTRTRATGPFLERALAIDGTEARIELLNRGQDWVARRIAAALPRIGDTRVRTALWAMHESHLENIVACSLLMAAPPMMEQSAAR